MIQKMKVKEVMLLCSLQNKLNEAIIPGWRHTDTPYLRAAWNELAEGFNHYGWAWWKKTDPDMPAYMMECIDYNHFAISAFMQHYKNMSDEQLRSKLDQVLGQQMLSKQELSSDTLTNLETVIALCCRGKWVDKILTHGFQLCFDSDMTPTDIIASYLGKNILNMFRKNNGYKAGTYVKIWNGVEDNEYIQNYIKKALSDNDNFVDDFIADQNGVSKKIHDYLDSIYLNIAAVSSEDNKKAYAGSKVDSVASAVK